CKNANICLNLITIRLFTPKMIKLSETLGPGPGGRAKALRGDAFRPCCAIRPYRPQSRRPSSLPDEAGYGSSGKPGAAPPARFLLCTAWILTLHHQTEPYRLTRRLRRLTLGADGWLGWLFASAPSTGC